MNYSIEMKRGKRGIRMTFVHEIAKGNWFDIAEKREPYESEEYKYFGIAYNYYGNHEYSAQDFDSNEIMVFTTIGDAKNWIDEWYRTHKEYCEANHIYC